MNLHWGCHEIDFLPNLDSEHISCLVAETKCKIFWTLLPVQSWFLIDFGTCKGVCNKCEIFKAKSWQYHWGIIVWRWTLESCKSLELIDITWYKTWYSTDINLNGYGSLTHSLARTQKREFSRLVFYFHHPIQKLLQPERPWAIDSTPWSNWQKIRFW